MAAAVHKAGASSPVATGTSKVRTEKDAATVVVEGLYSDLDALTDVQIAGYVPSGYTLVSSRLDPRGGGMGALTLATVKYDDPSASGLAAIKTTFRVRMAEVQYDLEDHPYLAGTYRDICLKWLATDEAVRVSGDGYYYTDENGAPHLIEDERAQKFIKAYMAGIKTFNRYFPVIDKISIWKNPPGLAKSGVSFTSGAPKFSANMGKWEDPPISLNGFPEKHWFKSDDSWTENENRTWTENEQWTYTPETSNGEHSWIYSEFESGASEGEEEE